MYCTIIYNNNKCVKMPILQNIQWCFCITIEILIIKPYWLEYPVLFSTTTSAALHSKLQSACYFIFSNVQINVVLLQRLAQLKDTYCICMRAGGQTQSNRFVSAFLLKSYLQLGLSAGERVYQGLATAPEFTISRQAAPALKQSKPAECPCSRGRVHPHDACR